MNGQTTTKGFSAYQVNEAILAKVLEAVRTGEADARRTKQTKSFEVYYNGFRERLVFGRIVIVPAACADDPETFPSALLYGALVRELTPEDQADLYSYKLGESEYDKYDAAAMKNIKNRLFMDEFGELHSIIIFIPTWVTVREYVTFKMTKDPELLARMIRHQIFATYYDPKFSSAFDHLVDDTDNFNVSDITPKTNYPGLSDGTPKDFPILLDKPDGQFMPPWVPYLRPGDNIKRASQRKPIRLLASDVLDDVMEIFLVPDEVDVIDMLDKLLTHKLDEAQEATAKQAKPKPSDYDHKVMYTNDRGLHEYYRCSDCKAYFPTRALLASHEAVCPGPTENKESVESKATERKAATTRYFTSVWKHKGAYRYEVNEQKSNGKTATLYHGEALTKEEAQRTAKAKTDLLTNGLRTRPDYDGGHGFKSNEMAERDASEPSSKKAADDGSVASVVYQRLTDALARAEKLLPYNTEWNAQTTSLLYDIQVLLTDVEYSGEFAGRPELIDLITTANGMVDQILEHVGDDVENSVLVEDLISVLQKLVRKQSVMSVDGGTLNVVKGSFYAKAASGHTEKLLINGNKIKWVRPLQFTAAFRQAAETFVRNPRNTPKKADPKRTPVERTAPVIEAKTAKVARNAGIGKCAACGKAVQADEGSEVAPDKFLHLSCQQKQEKAKEAAFDMFIPSQVAREFYPDVLNKVVDYPGGQVTPDAGYDPAIGLPGLSPTGVKQSPEGIPGNGDPYVTTDPSTAMGLGNTGKPQVLEGAPLRQENDIRGYMFDQEYYTQQTNLDPQAFVAAYAVKHINKKASTEEFQAQFADFLKRAMGEVAASFIALFRITSRPPMNKVPGTGEIKLSEMEANGMSVPFGTTQVGSRVRFLMSKLNDSQIQEAINAASAQSAVWSEQEEGGYIYEVFVRADSIDKNSDVIRYEFIVGTKGV